MAKKQVNAAISESEAMEIIERAFKVYDGDITVLESAVASLILGRYIGWHALRIVHMRSYSKYEKILAAGSPGFRFRDVLPARGPYARKMQVLKVVDSLGKFWQVVSGNMVSAYDAREVTA